MRPLIEGPAAARATRRLRTVVVALVCAAGARAALGAHVAPRTQARAVPQARAVFTDTAPRIDGALDEPAWQKAPALTGFVQREPREGAPASEPTTARILFDRTTIYVRAVLQDSEPDKITAALRGRDLWKLTGLWDNSGPDDSLAILLDTFADGRNGYYFAVNPNGAMTDALITGEGLNKNFEWDGVWRAAARQVSQGWTVEAAIPFETIRYGPPDASGELTFGLNVQRIIRRKTEEDFWAPIEVSGTLWWFSRAGRLVGLRAPTRTRVAELKPFVVVEAIRTEAAGSATDMNLQPGVDARLGLTSGLTLDLTVNTDFAQVEVDEQQVNFTRFSLFFPEKREFFLEGAGTFNFGFRDESKLFFSRRVGLDEMGRAVPITWGAKAAGKAGRWELGTIVARTGETTGMTSATQTVVRARRQLFARSSVGAMVTDVQRRQPGFANQVVGIDADVTMLNYLTVNSFVARSFTRGAGGDGTATSLYVHWDTDVFGLQYIFHDFDAEFRPGLGFFPRVDIRRDSPGTRVAWRPKSGPVRRYLVRTIWDWYHDGDGVQRTRHHLLHGTITLNNGDEFFAQAEHFTESPERAFVLGPGVIVPVGVYRFPYGTARYTMSPARQYGATAAYSWGGFYGGRRRQIQLRGTAKVTSHLAILPTYERNDVDLPHGRFTSNLAGIRVNYNLSNRFITNTFVQYNDVIDRVTVNLRLDFIYRPNSDVYFVWNEGRDTGELMPGLPLRDRAVMLKLVHLFRRK